MLSIDTIAAAKTTPFIVFLFMFFLSLFEYILNYIKENLKNNSNKKAS